MKNKSNIELNIPTGVKAFLYMQDSITMLFLFTLKVYAVFDICPINITSFGCKIRFNAHIYTSFGGFQKNNHHIKMQNAWKKFFKFIP